jgi:hypothetical protein
VPWDKAVQIHTERFGLTQEQLWLIRMVVAELL